MESLSSELFSILKFLLPGFLTAWVFHAFTSYPKPSQFERVVQALIFTVFVQALTYSFKFLFLAFGNKFFALGSWTSDVALTWSYISAAIIGLIFSYGANTDYFHALLRKLHLTKQTSYHCEWFGAFHARENSWVVLHLVDDKRIYGWPHEWPSDPSKGHFVLMYPAWIDGDDYIDLPQVESIMFKVSDIKWVEFIKPLEENSNVEKST
ncbi:DUF6338 family protein [Scandinavium goeteborgense]|uniref:DUF6338 family protein n=1 Tax=Scandinavium goeteborgense TaxID=1851514 RepID=UPI00216584F5|nr:DUF6338 family protein [Scandinavium goeteborgense]MCS2152409.1 DUF6338 family protein [Scandinavium goeteborgense]